MNKQEYRIGRDSTCQICIPDTPQTQKASRLHAILKVMGNGKIFITDCSSNGTSVNGVKIASNIDYPVKRGDTISFANVTELNWESIPKSSHKTLLCLVAAALVLGAGLAV
ncbi:MAG: FHA domain-containing protein, partial [Tannerella sp.]|nr:FHA domain-containing protein [Tannerella sp.]